MKLIEPSVKILINKDNNAHIAKCARICYAADTNNDTALINNLKLNGHLSMFRHGTNYYEIPTHLLKGNTFDILVHNILIPTVLEPVKSYLYCAVNYQVYLENKSFWDEFVDCLLTDEQIRNIPIAFENIYRYTFDVITQISTSRELNRVSPNNIAEQSTRYCNYSKLKFDREIKICRPHWLDDEPSTSKLIVTTWNFAENTYMRLIEYGMKPQDARGVLPLDTATECAYTYSIEEWRHIIDLRYYGTNGTPHPNAKIIANLIRKKLIEDGQKFREG